jgi:chromosome segregation ATPase
MTTGNGSFSGNGTDRLDRIERILAELAERDAEFDRRMAEQDVRYEARAAEWDKQFKAHMAERLERDQEYERQRAKFHADLAAINRTLEAMAERDRINEERLNEQSAAIARFAQIADELATAVQRLSADVRGLRLEVQRILERLFGEEDRG